MVMPAIPTTDLVFIETAFALSVLLEARSTQKRCPCINASRSTDVSSEALLKLYLISLGESISRLTINCQQCASSSSPSQTRTRPCRMYADSVPYVVSRIGIICHVSSGCRAAHSSTRIGSVCAFNFVGFLPRFDFGSGMVGSGFSR